MGLSIVLSNGAIVPLLQHSSAKLHCTSSRSQVNTEYEYLRQGEMLPRNLKWLNLEDDRPFYWYDSGNSPRRGGDRAGVAIAVEI
ncbi:hypothetical protein [Phormidesmis priestleyi]|uniref:hypothetical protein n=1 Tax=Phormidesmis priestleyi TaxID=268141 RepID=UPI0011601ABC|nr:hypothetical protein [Phormidesmis priestleyi]